MPKRRLKMQREIGNEVKIGDSVTPFKTVGKSKAIDKTALDINNANLKVKKIRRHIYSWNFGRGLSGND